MKIALGRVLIVTDRRAAEEAGRDVVDAVAEALGGLGPAEAVVQLRGKDLPASELMALARRLTQVCREHRAPLLVNDRVDVALAAGADGVHLPEAGLDISAVRRLARRDFLIGRSVHGADGAGAAARDGADIIVCGPIWDTPQKRGLGEPLGLEELAHAAEAVAGAGDQAHLYAIGGVDSAERAAACAERGVYGVAGIRAFMVGAPSPGEAAAAFAKACASE